MKKNGFTLIELLGVIVIIAVITILIIPPLLSSINGNKDTISEANKRIVYSATDLYISDNLSSFPKYEGSTYCINIDTLIFKNLLDEKIYNENTGIKDDNVVRVYINNNKYEKSIVKNVDCVKKLITSIVKGEDKSIASYFDYTNDYNSVSCSSDVDGGVSNSNELSVGLHRLTCSFDGFNMSIDAKVYENEYVFNYTGNVQEFDVPISGTYKVELWGAQGGNYTTTYTGGYGGYVSGNINLEKNTKFSIYVGSQPTGVDGGYNGGGSGYTEENYGKGYGGGGATDIRYNGTSLNDRIIVAGAGGGISYYDNDGYLIGTDGHAGGLNGNNGSFTIVRSTNSGTTWYSTTTSALGGTQVSGGTGGRENISSTDSIYYGGSGTFGTGGNGRSSHGGSSGAGGGAGYYGGGGTGRNGFAGGGGSSYISGHTGCVAITSASSQTPKSGCTTGTTDNDCSKHYSDLVFTDTKMIDGSGYKWTNTKGSLEQMPNPSGGTYANGVGHSGNGYAKITLLSIEV